MGHLGWSEAQLRRTDLNAYEVAWRGYLDRVDDRDRTIYWANGVKYPEKEKRGPKKPVNFAKIMRARRAAQKAATPDG